MDRGCEFPEFIARLQDTLDAVADAEFLSRVAIKRPPAVAYEDNSLREAADHMVHEEVVRLPVVARDNPRKVIGWLTRSDLLTAHRQRLEDRSRAERAADPHCPPRSRPGRLIVKLCNSLGFQLSPVGSARGLASSK